MGNRQGARNFRNYIDIWDGEISFVGWPPPGAKQKRLGGVRHRLAEKWNSCSRGGLDEGVRTVRGDIIRADPHEIFTDRKATDWCLDQRWARCHCPGGGHAQNEPSQYSEVGEIKGWKGGDQSGWERTAWFLDLLHVKL